MGDDPIEGEVDSDDDEMVEKARVQREKEAAKKARRLERLADKALAKQNAHRLGVGGGDTGSKTKKISKIALAKGEGVAADEERSRLDIESMIQQVQAGEASSSKHAGVVLNVEGITVNNKEKNGDTDEEKKKAPNLMVISKENKEKKTKDKKEKKDKKKNKKSDKSAQFAKLKKNSKVDSSFLDDF